MPFSSSLHKVIKYPRAAIRTILVVVNNIYCVPTYLVWMFLLLPLKKIHKCYYYRIEGILFHWLLANVSMWSWTAGYEVVEMGDDITMAFDRRTLVLANHQSTSDVPLLMAAFNAKKGVLPNIMWIMDRLFKYTNFGAVSLVHQDFFIASGKSNRDKSLQQLKSHIQKCYIPRKRKWMVLFPEGGFLRKRKEVSQRFAEKNNLPVLNNVTLPRVGAMKAIMDMLGASDITGGTASGAAQDAVKQSESNNTIIPSEAIDQDDDDDCGNDGRVVNTGERKSSDSTTVATVPLSLDNCKEASYAMLNGQSGGCLEYILDITIAYPQGVPLDLPNIVHGMRDSCQTFLFYKLYHSSEVPHESEHLTQWLYNRFYEKEKLLEEFYRTAAWPATCTIPPTVVHQDLLRFLLIHLFFITSTYVHVQLILMLVNYTNTMYVYLLS
ncbi:acyl-CoA:lysophosphatidylglycerol acyltransferase 1-like isoform X1 [Anopheles bellator]|uniref:acyl-CoA:lysophosphatidylglycerol acyltransferase 1-like isoform X1 n=1 Tax=Anopheles bellator TaxID=139047 RepID=UPI0026494864|nr:acyl-CoA:lysophosphatidylglycerol acyltransferase 1-like isoform X1 [Anopheles bellator]